MNNERVEFGVNSSIQRIEEKCTHCGMCKKTCDKIHDINGECIRCGQCILTCPMGALTPVYNYQPVLNYLKDTDYTVCISIAPAARVSIINELKFSKENSTEMLVGLLRLMGFDYVYDVAFGADITTIEESLEFIERIKLNKFPLITSCCPSWKKYALNHGYSEYISSTKSPMMMQGFLIKNYLTKYIEFDKKIINIMLMPCISKKEEISQDDNIDYVITTRELLYMVDELKIELNLVKPSSFDSLLGNASSSGIIFGKSGGVIESLIRTTYYFANNKAFDGNLKYEDNNGILESSIDINGINMSIALVSGMKSLKNIDIKKYNLIEVMACPNGCINGGGQPLLPNNKQMEIIDERKELLSNIDNNATLCKSYENSEVLDVYKYFVGKPGGKTAERYLHD